jgi:hypothetical protein
LPGTLLARLREKGVTVAKKKQPKQAKKTAFVPRSLVRTALVAVVPACALSCTAGTPTDAADGGNDAARDVIFQGVAAVAYPAYEAGTHDAGQQDADANVPDVFMGVAAVAYPAYEAGAG